MIYTVTLNTAVDRTIEVPELKIGGVHVGRTIFEQPAGKGVNVSRCLATMEIESVVGGFVGAAEAALFESSFAHTKARVRLIAVPGPTRRDTTLIDPILNTDTHIRESGYTVLPEHLDALRVELTENTKKGDIVVFCGSLPPGMGAADFRALLEHAQALGCRVAVDASGEALEQALHIRPFLMKPNRSELESLVGSPGALSSISDVVAAGRSLLGRVESLIVSLGKEGAVLFCAEAAWHAACPLSPAEVRSTVGCGDALVAGFLAGVARGKPLPECLRQGVAWGSACALTPAAGLIHPADVNRLLSHTELFQV